MNEVFNEEKNKKGKRLPAEVKAILAGVLIVVFVIFLQKNTAVNEQPKDEVQEMDRADELLITPQEQAELTQKSIKSSNRLLGVFQLVGDDLTIHLIGVDGIVIKSGPNDQSNMGVPAYVIKEYRSERGVYRAHAGYILNTDTGEYYEEANPYFHSVKIEGEEVNVISFLKSNEATTSLFVQTDDRLYSLVLDEKMRAIFESIVSEEETPIGEITIANDTLLIVAY